MCGSQNSQIYLLPVFRLSSLRLCAHLGYLPVQHTVYNGLQITQAATDKSHKADWSGELWHCHLFTFTAHCVAVLRATASSPYNSITPPMTSNETITSHLLHTALAASAAAVAAFMSSAVAIKWMRILRSGKNDVQAMTWLRACFQFADVLSSMTSSVRMTRRRATCPL